MKKSMEKKIENTIYIDELIVKIFKHWKGILIGTLIFTVIMGLYGYNTFNGEYVYKYVFVVSDTDYDDINDTLNLVLSVMYSNALMQESLDESQIDMDAAILLETLNRILRTNGTIELSMNIPKDLAQEVDLEFYTLYCAKGMKILADKFPNCKVTVIDEPYVALEPENITIQNKEVVLSIIKYMIYGVIVGMIISVFFTAVCILWNPKEYQKS